MDGSTITLETHPYMIPRNHNYIPDDLPFGLFRYYLFFIKVVEDPGKVTEKRCSGLFN